MSFTFVYGNHMDLYQASLAPFDAEPGEIYFSILCLLVNLFGLIAY